MKTISATIGERVAAVGLLNAGKFSNSVLAIVLDDIKKFAVTEEEWKKANLVKTPSDEEIRNLPADTRQTWRWDETLTKDIELQKETVSSIVEMINAKSDAKELTVNDAAVLTLQAKLDTK